MKKLTALLLAAALLLSMTACRRRVMENADDVIYETVYGELITDTTEDTQPEETEPEETQPTQPEDTTAPPVEETVPAPGGDPDPSAPDTPTVGPEITVSLDPNGGTCAASAVTVNVGGTYGNLPTPKLEQYTFAGWYTARDGGDKVSASTVVLNGENHTLYAHWTRSPSYTLTLDPNGGRLSSYNKKKTVYQGEAYGALPTPYNEGYLFLGWYTQKTDGKRVTADSVFNGDADLTLYAQWKYDPYSYWSHVLKNTTQKMFDCQKKSVYLELVADHTTVRSGSFLEDVYADNIAINREDPNVTDEWVIGKNPDVIVKLVSGTGSAASVYAAMTARLPGYPVYVVPEAAVSGTKEQQLYYRLCLAKLLYPAYFRDVDVQKAARELGVDGSIYHG